MITYLLGLIKSKDLEIDRYRVGIQHIEYLIGFIKKSDNLDPREVVNRMDEYIQEFKKIEEITDNERKPEIPD